MEAYPERMEAIQGKLEAMDFEANQEKEEPRAQHYNRAPRIKAMHMLAAQQGPAFNL